MNTKQRNSEIHVPAQCREYSSEQVKPSRNPHDVLREKAFAQLDDAMTASLDGLRIRADMNLGIELGYTISGDGDISYEHVIGVEFPSIDGRPLVSRSRREVHGATKEKWQHKTITGKNHMRIVDALIKAIEKRTSEQ